MKEMDDILDEYHCDSDDFIEFLKKNKDIDWIKYDVDKFVIND